VAKTKSERDFSQRLKKLLASQLPARGKFALLEELSEIPVHRWKNYWYGKQLASPDMIEFAAKRFPDEAAWLTAGLELSKAPAAHETARFLLLSEPALKGALEVGRDELKPADLVALEEIVARLASLRQRLKAEYVTDADL
jgi:hypothetical protein